jgi:hypothetical protein
MSWTSRLAAALAVVGAAAMGWLLIAQPSYQTYDAVIGSDRRQPPDDGGTYVDVGGGWYATREVTCAAVLDGPPSDHPEDRSAARERYDPLDGEDTSGSTEDDPGRDEGREGDDWIATACDRLRQQRLGMAILSGLPTILLIGVAGFDRLRRLIWTRAPATDTDSWASLLERAHGQPSAASGADAGGRVDRRSGDTA